MKKSDIFCYLFITLALISIAMIEFCPFQTEFVKQLVTKRINITDITLDKNEYYVDSDFKYVQNDDHIYPKNYQELVNAFRTAANAGEKNAKFYCARSYKDCIKDMKKFAKAKAYKNFASLYVFNHPFNDFSTTTLTFNPDIGNIEIDFEKKYTKDQIKQINEKIDSLYKELYRADLSDKENILIFNDWLRANIEYDKVKADKIKEKSDVDSEFASDTAYGALFEGKAICSGYTDAMYLYIERLGLKQMRVLGVKHIWNAVELDGKWYHIDATWDDSEAKSNEYFMIDTKTLLELDTEYHTFDKTVYKELE